jgi:hypothetical protein
MYFYIYTCGVAFYLYRVDKYQRVIIFKFDNYILPISEYKKKYFGLNKYQSMLNLSLSISDNYHLQ